jgi:glycosyltransferase involved in cell wall biosynthesis
MDEPATLQDIPLVSVIIPHFNRGERIAPTLASLNAQTLQDWELIVVDDASTVDPTPAIHACVPAATVLRQTVNRGPAAARNRGIDAARGRFVAFLDSDDLWEPGKLAAQIAAIKAQSEPDRMFCVTRTKVVDGMGRSRILPTRAVNSGERFDDFLFVSGEFAQSSGFLLSLRAAAAIRFHEDLRQYEDYLFFCAAGEAGMHYLLVEEPLVVWHNDDRSDRLSRTDDLVKADRFLAVAGPAVAKRARLAFETRFLASVRFKSQPLKTLSTTIKALANGAVGWRDIVLLAMKLVLPQATYGAIKSRLTT